MFVYFYELSIDENAHVTKVEWHKKVIDKRQEWLVCEGGTWVNEKFLSRDCIFNDIVDNDDHKIQYFSVKFSYEENENAEFIIKRLKNEIKDKVRNIVNKKMKEINYSFSLLNE